MRPSFANSAGTADFRDAARSVSGHPADAVPLFGPRFEQEPAALYREMRARFGPVAPVVLEDGHPAWLERVGELVGRLVRTVELGGQRIAEGDLLMLGLAAANADPLVRAGMDRYAAGNHAHLSFSHGEHRCPSPAQAIAEVMVTTAVEVLLDRLPDVTLAVDPDALLWQPSPWTRGLADSSRFPFHSHLRAKPAIRPAG
jgi:hypothetical protein